MICLRCRLELFVPDADNPEVTDKVWDEPWCYPHTAPLKRHIPTEGGAPVAHRVLETLRFLSAYAMPIRGTMPLSSTEVDAAKAAARILRGKSRAQNAQ